MATPGIRRSDRIKHPWQAEVFDKRSGRRVRKHFDTYDEAVVWRSDVQRAIRTGERSAKTTPTLREAADELVAGMKSGAIASRGGRPYRASVIRKYEQTLARYVLKDLGAHKLSDLTHLSLLEHAERLRASRNPPLAPNTVRRAFDPLRVILRRAHARGLIAQNPALGLELPTGEVKPRDRAAAPALVLELVARFEDSRDRALWATAFYAGLRLGELRALRWRHVDLAAQRIHVEQSMDDKGELGPPKTKAGVRTLPITPHLGAPLVALLGDDTPHPDAFVFAEPDGRPLVYRSAIRRAADLHDWTLHEARHSCISIWAAAIRNPKRVQTMAGHASIVMTLDRYGKALGVDDDQASREVTAYLDAHTTADTLRTLARDDSGQPRTDDVAATRVTDDSGHPRTP